jgi:hypothetical protein
MIVISRKFSLTQSKNEKVYVLLHNNFRIINGMNPGKLLTEVPLQKGRESAGRNSRDGTS